MGIQASAPVDLHSASTIGGSQVWSAGAFLNTTANIDTDNNGTHWTTSLSTDTTRGTKPTTYVTVTHLGGNGAGTGTQIASTYSSADEYYIRRRSDNAGSPNGANAWQPWRKLWHDGNLTPGNYVLKGGDTMTGTLTGTRFHVAQTAAANGAYSSAVTGDTNNRFEILADGTHRWGPGNAGHDAQLSRHSAGNLQIGSNLIMTEQGRVVTDCNAVTAPGCWGLSGTPTNGPSGGPWSPMLVLRNIDVGLQVAGGYNDKLHFRGWTGYGDLPGEWTAWREVIHSGNISTQAVASATSATNATYATALTTIWQNTPALDLNTMGLGRGNNYNSPTMFTNGPAGVSYGSVYNLGGQSASILSLQLLADVNHNVATSTKSLYFRTGNNLGFQADWKEIWHTGNWDPANYSRLQTPGSFAGDARAVGNEGVFFAETTAATTNIPVASRPGALLQLADQGGNDVRFQFFNDYTNGDLFYNLMWGAGTWRGWKKIAPADAPAHTGDVNAVGFNGSWGATPNVGYRTIMGTASSATWLCYGTSGGTLRGGVQLLDAGGELRVYAGSNYLHLQNASINYNGNTIWHAGNLNPITATTSDQTMRYIHWDGYNRSQLANTLIGPRGLLYTAIAAGKPLYGDEEFALSAWVGLYNNSGGSAVTITWESDATAPNKSGKRVKITYDGVTLPAPSPGLGGFITPYTHRANAVIVQRFIAKIPVGFSVVNAENSPGTNGQVIWITPTAGTGKWEEYIRVVYCGDSGSFSSGGHVYLTGTGAVTWYLASANAYEITTPGTSGINDYQIADVAWSKVTSKPTIKSPIYFYFEPALATTDKQPVIRIDAPSTIVAVRYLRDNTTAPTVNGVISIRKNGTEIYSITVSTAHANQTYIDISTSQTALVAGDRISAVVVTAGTGCQNLTVQLEINQQVG